MILLRPIRSLDGLAIYEFIAAGWWGGRQGWEKQAFARAQGTPGSCSDVGNVICLARACVVADGMECDVTCCVVMRCGVSCCCYFSQDKSSGHLPTGVEKCPGQRPYAWTDVRASDRKCGVRQPCSFIPMHAYQNPNDGTLQECKAICSSYSNCQSFLYDGVDPSKQGGTPCCAFSNPVQDLHVPCGGYDSYLYGARCAV